MVIWDDPADDVTGVIARSEKVAGTFEKVSYTQQSGASSAISDLTFNHLLY